MPTKVYLDLCALKRPFDRISEDPIQMEALAVVSLLRMHDEKEILIQSSSPLEFENHRNPNEERRHAVESFLARELRTIRLNPLDALHLASAEFTGCRLFVTCDLSLLRKAKMHAASLHIAVVDPVEALGIMKKETQ